MRIRRENWTAEEDATLQEMTKADRPIEEIALAVGRTVPAVRSRGYILRLRLRGQRSGH